MPVNNDWPVNVALQIGGQQLCELAWEGIKSLTNPFKTSILLEARLYDAHAAVHAWAFFFVDFFLPKAMPRRLAVFLHVLLA